MANRCRAALAAMALSAVAGLAVATPSLTTLGGGSPLSVTNAIAGTVYIGGSGLSSAVPVRWVLNGVTLTATEVPSLSGGGFISMDGQFITGSILNNPRFASGNTATGVSPAFSPNPTLTVSATLPGATEFGGARYSFAGASIANLGTLPIIPYTAPVPGLAGQGTSGIYGTSSSGGTTSSFVSPNSISSTGQFIPVQAYACVFNTGSTAGTQITANSFYWRPALWDSSTGVLEVLPTPFRSSQTATGGNNRRRTGNPYRVSSDGTVVVGATEHNVGTTPGPDVDGGRLVVWRKTAGVWTMSYLDTGLDGSGFPNYVSSTPSAVTMNSAGTIIVARGANGVIQKWVWDSGASSWGAPINIGSNLSAQASWLPVAVTSCGVPPLLGEIVCMSEDGTIIAGTARYSTCGSFMSGGFIWHQSDGLIQDWYDYNVGLGTPGVGPGGLYGPIGDGGNPAKGLPAAGSPFAISPDGTMIVGRQTGQQLIPGAPSWIWHETGIGCVAPTITLQPAAVTNFSGCTTSIILNAGANGTGPFTYQWYKDGVAMFDGTWTTGAQTTGTTSFQMRLNPPLSAADAGTYWCVITGQCGTPAETNHVTVQVDPTYAVAPANDTCAGARVVTQGTNVISPAQTPCNAFVNDAFSGSSCVGTTKLDLWYKFTPATSGNYRLDTCGANFDTVLSVFDNCGGNELACNNDYLTGPTSGCTNSRSRVSSLAMTANVPYYIRVSTPLATFLTAGTSTVNLSINPAPVLPANDECTSAQVITDPGVYPYLTTEALATPGLSTLSCSTTAHQSRDLWYQYTAVRDQRITLSTCPAGTAPSGYTNMTNTVLSIHDGPCGAVLFCNDDHSPVPSGCGTQLSTITNFLVAGGQSIWIRVSGSSSTTHGAGQLTFKTCFSDITEIGGTAELPGNPDGQLTVDDIIVFVNLFSDGTGCPGTAPCSRADVTGLGGPPELPDGQLTVDDIIAFFNAYSDGCA